MTISTELPELVVLTGDGAIMPLSISPGEAAPLLGRSAKVIRAQCEAGLLPTLPACTNDGRTHWRIATARLLKLLGMQYEVVSTGEAS